MNWTQVQSKWKNISAKIHARWGKLTDDDIRAIAGHRDELVQRLQMRYAMDRERAEKEAEAFIKTLN